MAPIQLSPNAYRYLTAFFILYHKLGLGEPSMVEIKYIYLIKSHLSRGFLNKNYSVFFFYLKSLEKLGDDPCGAFLKQDLEKPLVLGRRLLAVPKQS